MADISKIKIATNAIYDIKDATARSNKIDKVQSAVADNLAKLTESGEVADAGVAASALQPKTMSQPISIGGASQTTVEGAIGALAETSGTATASAVSYSHTSSGLDATNVQEALDEVVNLIPEVGTAAAKDVPVSGNASSTQVVMGNDIRLSDSRPASDVSAWAKASSKPSYTATEVGLGNVPNVSTNDQTPTYTEATTRANLTSGEKLSVAFGKIKKFFSDLKTVAFSGSYNDLSDTPTLGTAAAKNIPSSGNASSTQVVMGSDTRLTDARPASDVAAWAKAESKPSYSYSEISNTPTLGTAAAKDVALTGNASATQVVMGNDSRLTDARSASDVYSWAKASSKPSYTASEVGAIASTAKGAANGVAELDSSGKVPSSQLPSYVDDVLEYTSKSDFPTTGETGKIYIAKDTNKTYRWSGTAYVEISESLALGETSATAYAGDKGKANADAITAIKNGSSINTFGGVELALSNKVDKVSGKGLSTNDFTTTLKNKLDGIASGAEVNVQSDWDQTTSTADDYIKNKPTSMPASDVYAWAKAASKPSYTASEVGLGNVPNVATNDQTPTFTAASTRANIATGEKLSVILGKIAKWYADLKTVAFSGSYTDLTNKPTIPDAQIQSDWSQTTSTAKDYIKNKPTSMPASDVYSWAKASSKPSYSYSEISGTPTLGTAAAKDVPSSGNAITTQVVLGSDTRLTNSRPASDVSAWAKASTKPSYSYSEITGTPTLGTAAAKDVPSTGNASSTQVVMGSDTRLTNSRPASDVYDWAKASSKPSYTASEVGLGNVPNVATNDQTPTYTEATIRANLTSGEKLSVALGKIKKYFTDLGTAAFKSVPSSGNASTSQVVMGNDSRLSDSRNAADVYSWAKASTKPSYTASEVGAAASSHNQAASTITAGTLGGKVQANATAMATLGDFQVRDIKISNSDITAGSTSLTSGSIYIYYS